jgi:hypothetical protein
VHRLNRSDHITFGTHSNRRNVPDIVERHPQSTVLLYPELARRVE